MGGCVLSLLPMERHGRKKLLIDFPVCGMVSVQWFLEQVGNAYGSSCGQLDGMPRWAVLLTHQPFQAAAPP